MNLPSTPCCIVPGQNSSTGVSVRKVSPTIVQSAPWPSNGSAFSMPAGRLISLTMNHATCRPSRPRLFPFLLLDWNTSDVGGQPVGGTVYAGFGLELEDAERS